MLGLVTARVAHGLDPDLDPLASACADVLDGAVAVVDWDDPDVSWASFDAVVLRSTWDYTRRLDEFLTWVGRVAKSTRVLNPPAAVRWSADKRYLADLAGAGIPIVPTTFVAPGEPAPTVEGLHVVKPSVGAGSADAARCGPAEVDGCVRALHASGRTALVQPYLDLLDSAGETALCFVSDGRGGLEPSHAFRKEAILAGGPVEQEGGLFAKESISPATPTPGQLELATRVLASPPVRACGELAFARLDLAPARSADGAHDVVMELELIEPSFYFHTSSGAARRMAERLAVHVSGGRR